MENMTKGSLQKGPGVLPRLMLLGLLVMLSSGNCGRGDPAGGMVSGRVVLESGNGLAGVTITASGSGGGCSSFTTTTTTDDSGYYLFYTGDNSGSGTLTPSLTGYTFTPVSRDVTISNNNAVRDQDFMATAGTL